MPGIESGWGGIELTSFTKKESATNESTKLKSATRSVTEESHDHKAVGSVDTESVEAKQVKLEKVSSWIQFTMVNNDSHLCFLSWKLR